MLQVSKKWFIKHAQEPWSIWFLGFFSFTESIFLPVPTDTLMMLMLLIGENAKRWLYYATITMLTSVLGATVGYILSFWLFDVFGTHFIALYGLEDVFHNTQLRYTESVFLFTFIGAISPIPYKIFVLSAGFLKVNFITFIIASIVGRSMRLYLSAWLVYAYGEKGVLLARRYAMHLLIIGCSIIVVYILGYIVL